VIRNAAGLVGLLMAGCSLLPAPNESSPAAFSLRVINLEVGQVEVLLNKRESATVECGDAIDLTEAEFGALPWIVVVETSDGRRLGTTTIPVEAEPTRIVIRTRGIDVSTEPGSVGPAPPPCP